MASKKTAVIEWLFFNRAGYTSGRATLKRALMTMVDVTDAIDATNAGLSKNNAANFYKEQSWSIRSSVTNGSVKAAYSCSSCDRLQLVTGTAPELGIVTVKVTDQTGATLASATVDEYASTRQGAHVVFDSGILPTTAGKVYTLTVTPTGTKNPNATDFWTEVQAVRTSALPVTSSYNQPPPRP